MDYCKRKGEGGRGMDEMDDIVAGLLAKGVMKRQIAVIFFITDE